MWAVVTSSNKSILVHIFPFLTIIANTIEVVVLLLLVFHQQTIITYISYTITVSIFLIFIFNGSTIVLYVFYSIIVNIIITSITLAIFIWILLIRIWHCTTVVTDVPNTIRICILLIRIVDIFTVISFKTIKKFVQISIVILTAITIFTLQIVRHNICRYCAIAWCFFFQYCSIIVRILIAIISSPILVIIFLSRVGRIWTIISFTKFFITIEIFIRNSILIGICATKKTISSKSRNTLTVSIFGHKRILRTHFTKDSCCYIPCIIMLLITTESRQAWWQFIHFFSAHKCALLMRRACRYTIPFFMMTCIPRWCITILSKFDISTTHLKLPQLFPFSFDAARAFCCIFGLITFGYSLAPLFSFKTFGFSWCFTFYFFPVRILLNIFNLFKILVRWYITVRFCILTGYFSTSKATFTFTLSQNILYWNNFFWFIWFIVIS